MDRFVTQGKMNGEGRSKRKFRKNPGLTPVTTYIKGQRIQWLGHIMRRGEEKTIYGMETEREKILKQTEDEVSRRSRRGSKSSGSTRTKGNCSRSRWMEGCNDGSKDSNRVINTSEEEVEAFAC